MVKFALSTVSVMVKAPLALENWLGWLSLHRMSIPAYLIADSQLICFDFWMFPTTCTFGGFARRVASNEEAGEEVLSGGYVL